MKHRHFLSKLDTKRIEAAIQAAELPTSGEICVIVHHRPVDDALALAQREFVRRGMQKTVHRNAILLFVAPVSQKFAVVGDQAVHARCGDSFWQDLAAVMTDHFKAGEYTEALVQGIGKAGSLLARYFPREGGSRNELPDQVIEQ